MPEIQALKTATKADMVTFPMCELGHDSQKLTTLMVTPGLVDHLKHLGDLKCSHKTHRQVGGADENGEFTSAQTSAYPSQLNAILANAIGSKGRKLGEAGTQQEGVETATISLADVCGYNRGSTDPKWLVGWDTQEGGQQIATIDYDELTGI